MQYPKSTQEYDDKISHSQLNLPHLESKVESLDCRVQQAVNDRILTKILYDECASYREMLRDLVNEAGSLVNQAYSLSKSLSEYSDSCPTDTADGRSLRKQAAAESAYHHQIGRNLSRLRHRAGIALGNSQWLGLKVHRYRKRNKLINND